MVTYFKNQKELAKALIIIMDSYWSEHLPENEMVTQIVELVNKNMDMVFSDKGYSSVINQRLGKKRIRMLNKIIGIMEDCK